MIITFAEDFPFFLSQIRRVQLLMTATAVETAGVVNLYTINNNVYKSEFSNSI